MTFHPLVFSLSSVVSHLVKNENKIFWNIAKIHKEISLWSPRTFREILWSPFDALSIFCEIILCKAQIVLSSKILHHYAMLKEKKYLVWFNLVKIYVNSLERQKKSLFGRIRVPFPIFAINFFCGGSCRKKIIIIFFPQNLQGDAPTPPPQFGGEGPDTPPPSFRSRKTLLSPPLPAVSS